MIRIWTDGEVSGASTGWAGPERRLRTLHKPLQNARCPSPCRIACRPTIGHTDYFRSSK